MTNHKLFSFTLVEVMVAVGILAVLATMILVVISGLDNKAKTARTQAQMQLLGQAVTAFKDSTGYFPLAVPEDVWGATDWTLPGGFTDTMTWLNRWQQYFVKSASNQPTFSPSSFSPTNIHMLAFQLEQAPAASKIFGKLKETYSVAEQKSFSTPETWKKESNDCQITHPLGGPPRTVYQVQDAWGTPLRFWTGDILKWAKTGGNWHSSIQQLLSTRLQQANWGFFVESAGKDGKFGWWGAEPPVQVNSQQAGDNVYSTGP